MGEYILKDDGTVIINEGVTIIDNKFFEKEDKAKIKRVILPNSLTTIGDYAFHWFDRLESVEIPDSVTNIGKYAFHFCSSLKNVKLPKGIKEIPNSCFYGAKMLREINIPNGVEVIGEHAFAHCERLEKVHFPSELRSLGAMAFWEAGFKEVRLPDKVEDIDQHCFWACKDLESVYLPDSLKVVGGKYMTGKIFQDCKNLKNVSCSLTTMFDRITLRDLRKLENAEFRFNGKVYKDDDFEVSLIVDGMQAVTIKDTDEVILINSNERSTVVTSKKELFAKATKWNELADLGVNNYIKLMDWNKYKVVPHKIVVQNMPKNDIPLFYKNNNAKNWAEIVKLANMTNDINKQSLFYISYALGVFSESGQESKVATEYIKENIIKKYDEDKIHEIFSGFSTYKTKYNSEYAKFFMLYFKDNPQFMHFKNDDGVDIDFLAQSYVRFEQVQKLYPNKKAVTRHDNERLTPELVIKAFAKVEYENVDERAVALADVIGFYGVSNEDYKRLEEWYLEGLEIPNDKMTLKIASDAIKAEIDGPESIEENVATISPNKGNGGQNFAINNEVGNVEGEAESADMPEKVAESDLIDEEPEVVKEDKRVTYELLEKSSTLGAVVGYITNCCQTINDNGESCVHYGMTKPNSSFLVFRNANNEILGQAWVWYDEKTKQVTLDNIEVPHCKLNNLNKDKELQDEFIDCLVRVRQGFISAMGNDKVQNVTIGMGYNDITTLIEKNFTRSKESFKLTNYNGYTDATCQFIITDRVKQKNVETKKILESEINL
ncbi:MAG: leucine-rich repeat domain-containing protein [Christensenellales bacterium]